MQSTIARVRMEKLEEAKNLVAELEDKKGLKLGGVRGSLLAAGQTVDSTNAFLRHMNEATGQLAGYAIEAGHDEIASEATAIVADLDDVESDRD